jgi:hypothetical protein
MSEAAVIIARNVLPPVLVVTFKAGGWKAVKGLTAAMGGKRIRIPKTAGDDHPLVAAAGRAAADAIMYRWGGEGSFEIPRGGHSLKLLLVAEPEAGSTNELAQRLGCTNRHVRLLRKEARLGKKKPARAPKPVDRRQLDLIEDTDLSRG